MSKSDEKRGENYIHCKVLHNNYVIRPILHPWDKLSMLLVLSEGPP